MGRHNNGVGMIEVMPMSAQPRLPDGIDGRVAGGDGDHRDDGPILRRRAVLLVIR